MQFAQCEECRFMHDLSKCKVVLSWRLVKPWWDDVRVHLPVTKGEALMVTSAAVPRLRDPLCFISPSPLTGKYAHTSLCACVCVCAPVCVYVCGKGRSSSSSSPALPNTSMQSSLESGLQQHKDQGYSGAASLPSADRKGLMRRDTHHL